MSKLNLLKSFLESIKLEKLITDSILEAADTVFEATTINKNISDFDKIFLQLRSTVKNYPDQIKRRWDALTKDMTTHEKNVMSNRLSNSIDKDPYIGMSGEQVTAAILGEDIPSKKSPVQPASDVRVAKSSSKKQNLMPAILQANKLVGTDPQKAYDLYARAYDASNDVYNKNYAKSAMAYMERNPKFGIEKSVTIDEDTEGREPTSKENEEALASIEFKKKQEQYEKLKDQTDNVYMYLAELKSQLDKIENAKGGLSGRSMDWDKYVAVKKRISQMEKLLKKQNNKIAQAKKQLDTIS